jgi:hypothetical protein
MGKKNGWRVLLGIQWDSASWEKVRQWGDFLLPVLERTPVCWAFPVPPFGGRRMPEDPFLSALRKRLKSGQDDLVSRGFRGAPHPLLTIDELDKELSWALKNPWGTGAADIFGIKPSIMAPLLADLSRRRAIETYLDNGFAWIGAEGQRPLAPITNGGITVFTYVRFGRDEGEKTIPRSILCLLKREKDLFLMVDISSFSTGAMAESTLSRLVGSFVSSGAEFLTLENLRAKRPTTGPLPVSQCSWSALPVGILRDRLAAALVVQQKKRKKNEDYKKILDLLVLQDTFADTGSGKRTEEGAGTRRHERTLVAHMQGDVTLIGSHFDVRLSGGRLRGIMKNDNFVTPGDCTASFITVNGKTFAFKARGAISFEGDSGTGLRVDLEPDGKSAAAFSGGSLSLEYEFRGDLPELNISLTARYPKLTAKQIVNALVPLSLPLLELKGGASVSLDVVCPDGSLAGYELTEKDGWRLIPGMTWSTGAPGRRIFLSAGQAADGKWGIFFFRIAKKRGRRVLEVCPFGSPLPVPGMMVSEKREVSSLLLGLE